MEDSDAIHLPVSRVSRSIFGHQFCISKEWSELLIGMGFRALVNGLALEGTRLNDWTKRPGNETQSK